MEANLDDVANGAGVAKGTLYRYFDNKAELYVAVLARDGADFERKMVETLDPELGPLDQIRRTGHFYFEHWIRHREYFQIFWAVQNQGVIGELPVGVLDEVTRLWETSLKLFAGIIAEGIRRGEIVDCDSWEVANMLWTGANGMIQTHDSVTYQGLRRRSLRSLFQDSLEIVLRGLATKPGPLPPPTRD